MFTLFLLFFNTGLTHEYRLNLSESLDIYAQKTAFAISDNGIFAITDLEEKQIVLLSGPNRSTVKRIGRKGNGPGEFIKFRAIKWHPRKRVFMVIDQGNERLVTLDQTGTILSEVPFFYNGYLADFEFGPNDEIYYARNHFGPKFNQNLLFIRPSVNAEEQQLWQYEYPQDWQFTNIRPNAPRPNIVFMHWDVNLRYGLGTDFAAVWTYNQQVLCFDLQGRQKGAPIALQMHRVPVQPAQVTQMLLGMPNLKTRERIRRNLVIPDFWPAVKHLAVDDEDRIWVFGFPKKVAGPHQFQVFHPRGKLLGEGHAPGIAHTIKSGMLYVLQQDQEDNLCIDAYRISGLP